MSALGTLKSLAKDALANPRIRRAYNGVNRAVLEAAGSSPARRHAVLHPGISHLQP